MDFFYSGASYINETYIAVIIHRIIPSPLANLSFLNNRYLSFHDGKVGFARTFRSSSLNLTRLFRFHRFGWNRSDKETTQIE